jgi:tetratricopeptide (TPR) repeat protein
MRALVCFFSMAFLIGGLAAQDKRPARESLEAYLKRLRAVQASQSVGLSASLTEILVRLEQDALARRTEALDRGREQLIALGAEAAPLLVEKLDPGAQASDAQKLVAQTVRRALFELRSSAVTPRLVELAQSASPDGRRNAVLALGSAPEPERAAPLLVGIVKGGPQELRDAALTSLANLKGAEADKALGEALSDPAPEVVNAALRALTRAKRADLAPRVLRLVESVRDAIPHVEALAAYYGAVPQAVDKAHALAILRLTQDFTPPPEQRARLLDLVPSFPDDSIENEGKKILRELGLSPTKEVRESALVALTLLGDKNARRDLFAAIETQVDRNKGYAQNYEERARLYYRIEQWRDAAKDYTTALKLSADDFRARPEGSYLGLARCHLQMGKLKDAAETLEKAPISLKELQALANDPLFQKLVENPKYRPLFRLDG